jgi:thioredoxin
MLPLILTIAIGGGIGAALGYRGQCSTGACPLTSTWWRGALYGGTLGLLFHFASGGAGINGSTEAPKNLKRIGEAAFAGEVLAADRPVVVDFYASWCGPCRTLAPVLDQLAGEYLDRIKFVQVNVDETPQLAREFDVSALPTLIFFRDGKVAGRTVGLSSSETIRAQLKTLMAGPVAAVATDQGIRE